MSALSDNQSPTLPQKIDSREGSFWRKKGLAPACSKMYFYLNRTPLTAIFRPFQQSEVRFAAKCNAFCRKMQCVSVQNASYFGTKCKVKWC